MKTYYTSISILFSIFFFAQCAGDNKQKTILYPNKDSELTLLMRDMHLYFEDVKKAIENGEDVQDIKQFQEILSSASTDPAKAESTLYKAMSKMYLSSSKKLSTATDSLPFFFNNMIDKCITCHKPLCPGPIVKIKKLYIE